MPGMTGAAGVPRYRGSIEVGFPPVRTLRGLEPGRPPTGEAIAEHLARWFLRSARPPGNATLLSVAVTTGTGEHGEIVLPVAT
jgi:hypothetical protein